MKVKITIPTSLSEIKLSQYQRFVKIMADNEEGEFLSLKMIEIFCNVGLDVANSMKRKDLNEAVTIISELFTKVPALVKQFEMEGKKFGFIPNLDEMSQGEYIDLDTYSTIENWQEMHRVMAILYRPIIQQLKEKYLIEPYETSSKYAEAMKDLPLDIALSAVVFFYRLGNDCLISTMDYLAENQASFQIQPNSESGGDGIQVSTALLREMLGDLMKLQNFRFINV